jgi:hypothetical protein
MSIKLIGEWMDELQDGFVEGSSGFLAFLRHNIVRGLTIATGPMAPMVVPMGTDTMLGYI